MTPYEAIGGEAAVRAVLQTLYDQLFVDPIVGFLFEGKDKAHLIDQQLTFTCRFLGGPHLIVQTLLGLLRLPGIEPRSKRSQRGGPRRIPIRVLGQDGIHDPPDSGCRHARHLYIHRLGGREGRAGGGRQSRFCRLLRSLVRLLRGRRGTRAHGDLGRGLRGSSRAGCEAGSWLERRFVRRSRPRLAGGWHRRSHLRVGSVLPGRIESLAQACYGLGIFRG